MLRRYYNIIPVVINYLARLLFQMAASRYTSL
jgi:hypothetical protein